MKGRKGRKWNKIREEGEKGVEKGDENGKGKR